MVLTVQNNSALLFIPEAGIHPFLATLCILGDAVKQKGFRVLLTECTGQMIRCPMFVMHRVPLAASEEDKRKICAICARHFKAANSVYNFEAVHLKKIISSSDLKKIDDICNVKSDKLRDVAYDGFKFGIVANYDYMLETKKNFDVVTAQKDDVDLYRAYVKNAILSYMIAAAIGKTKKYTLCLTFNEYAQGHAVRFYTESQKITRFMATCPTHLNVDFSKIQLSRKMYENMVYTHYVNFSAEFNKIFVLPERVIDCFDDSLHRRYAGGSHVFSSRAAQQPSEIFEKIGLNPNKKIVVAYTSSYDERIGLDEILQLWGETPAGVSHAFATQVEWLQFLKQYAERRDDVQIIVRIHPREGLRQFNLKSNHLRLLERFFSESTEYFKIIWADDPVSSYDLMELADIVSIPWSLMGLEAGKLGVPTLSTVKNLNYPDANFIMTAGTPAEYEQKLTGLLCSRPALESLTEAIRFYHWRIFVPSLDLSKVIPAVTPAHTFYPRVSPAMVETITDILTEQQDLIALRQKEWVCSLAEHSEAEELAAILEGIRALIETAFYPPVFKPVPLWFRVLRKSVRIALKKELRWKEGRIPRVKDFERLRLECHSTPQDSKILLKKTRTDNNLRILVTDGTYNEYYAHGQCLRRMSKMIGRLAGYLSSKPWENA